MLASELTRAIAPLRLLEREAELAALEAMLAAARLGDGRLVVVEGMTPTLIGIAVGAVGAVAAGRIMERFVFGVSASDPLTLAAVSGVLALVALIASVLPAYRASRLDPSEVLRAS